MSKYINKQFCHSNLDSTMNENHLILEKNFITYITNERLVTIIYVINL